MSRSGRISTLIVMAISVMAMQAFYGDQFRLYLTQMGVAADVAGIVERNMTSGHATQILPAGWLRFGIVTAPAP
jgi:hypothetical protein